MRENGITFKPIRSEILSTVQKRLSPPIHNFVIYEITEAKLREIKEEGIRETIKGFVSGNNVLIICDNEYYTAFSGNCRGIVELLKSYFETGDVNFCDMSGNKIEK